MLSTHLSVAECDIFAFEAIDTDIVALVMLSTSQPTHLQRETCFVVASRIAPKSAPTANSADIGVRRKLSKREQTS